MSINNNFKEVTIQFHSAFPPMETTELRKYLKPEIQSVRHASINDLQISQALSFWQKTVDTCVKFIIQNFYSSCDKEIKTIFPAYSVSNFKPEKFKILKDNLNNILAKKVEAVFDRFIDNYIFKIMRSAPLEDDLAILSYPFSFSANDFNEFSTQSHTEETLLNNDWNHIKSPFESILNERIKKVQNSIDILVQFQFDGSFIEPAELKKYLNSETQPTNNVTCNDIHLSKWQSFWKKIVDIYIKYLISKLYSSCNNEFAKIMPTYSVSTLNQKKFKEIWKKSLEALLFAEIDGIYNDFFIKGKTLEYALRANIATHISQYTFHIDDFNQYPFNAQTEEVLLNNDWNYIKKPFENKLEGLITELQKKEIEQKRADAVYAELLASKDISQTQPAKKNTTKKNKKGKSKKPKKPKGEKLKTQANNNQSNNNEGSGPSSLETTPPQIILSAAQRKVMGLNNTDCSTLSFHPRIARWKTKSLQIIREFIDFVGNGNNVQQVKKYENKSDEELKLLRAEHSLFGIDRLLSDPQLQDAYSTPYQFEDNKGQIHSGRRLSCSMRFENRTFQGNVRVAISDGVIYHALFEERNENRGYSAHAEENHNYDMLNSFEEGWEINTTFQFELIGDKIQLTVSEAENPVIFTFSPIA